MDEEYTDAGQEEVVYVMQEQKSNTSWIFYIIVIVILILGVYYVVKTLDDATNPFHWFSIIGGAINGK